MGWEWEIQCEENLSMKPTEESRSHPVKIELCLEAALPLDFSIT